MDTSFDTITQKFLWGKCLPQIFKYLNSFLVFHIWASSLADQHIPWFRDGDKSNLVTGIKLKTFEVGFSLLLLLNWIWQDKSLELLNLFAHTKLGSVASMVMIEMLRAWDLRTSYIALVKSMSTSAFSVISIDTFDFKLKKYKLVFNYLHPNESLKATLPSVLVTMAVE